METRTRRVRKDERHKERCIRRDDGRGELHKTNRNTAGSEKDRNWSFKSNLFCTPGVHNSQSHMRVMSTYLSALSGSVVLSIVFTC